MRLSCERHTEMQIPALFTQEVANSKKWKERVTQGMWEVGWRGWPAWWRAPAAAPVANRCCSFGRSHTHLITTWSAGQSYVRSRTAEQCFFLFSEPESYHQTGTEADPELGPGADATWWYRSREGIVRGQWPDSPDYATVLFDWLVGGWGWDNYGLVYIHPMRNVQVSQIANGEVLFKCVDVIPANVF